MTEPTETASSRTQELCAYLSGLRYADLTPRVVHQARRGLLDWLGCALAGSRHPAISTLTEVLQQASNGSQAAVLGRRMRLGMADAALANGQMGHVLDFDDTHQDGVLLHTSSPVLACLLALAEQNDVSGADLIVAYVVGFEAGVRSGWAAPDHHGGGWHLTGTLGSIAAGAAGARLLKLDGKGLTHAVAIAATQAGGMQQNRGTMCKSFHAGKAAANGVLAALLARAGFDGNTAILDGANGFSRIYSRRAAPERLTENLAGSFQIEGNGFKPYACGAVLHPVIDAMVTVRNQGAVDLAAIERVNIRVHPLVLSITGISEPVTGLQSKFSVYHAAAVALADGRAGIEEFSDARVDDPVLAMLRGKMQVTVDQALRKDEALAELWVSETVRPVHVGHASGTRENPMTDAAIEAKFMANAGLVLEAGATRRLAKRVWRLEEQANVSDLLRELA